MNITVREEQPADFDAVYAVNQAGFGRSDEADLVNSLRAEGVVLVSLVGEIDGRIVGHILFSRMAIETEVESIAAVALAPLAVAPEYQGRGIGSELVRHGLRQLRNRGEAIVTVLGHEHYYPRFGFSPEKARLLKSPFPPEAYMALELLPGALTGIHGQVRYPAAFGI